MDATHHRTRTLWLIGILHAFTHVYHVTLLPLYFLIQKDLKLASVEAAPLLVTVLGVSYICPSYLMGILADRFSRKRLLGVGLIINAIGFIGFSFCHSYREAISWMILAGLGGSFFHPAATALVARVCPESTGRALGLIGIGASVGFFFGPVYSGCRAVHTGNWRTPMLELGIAGLVVALLFLWLADDEVHQAHEHSASRASVPMFTSAKAWLCFLAACVSFSLRDFGGSGLGSMSSLFLQQAQGFDPQKTGFVLSGIFLASAVSNPLFGGLSDKGRMRWLCLVLTIAAGMIALFPHLPAKFYAPGLLVYGFFFLSSYPIVEAAVMESVHDSARGRTFGLFITVGGLVGNSAHWVVGRWIASLGDRATAIPSYFHLYGILAGMVLCSLVGIPFLKALGRKGIHPHPQPPSHPQPSGPVVPQDQR